MENDSKVNHLKHRRLLYLKISQVGHKSNFDQKNINEEVGSIRDFRVHDFRK